MSRFEVKVNGQTTPLNLRGLIWLLMMDWSEKENTRKRGPSWEAFRKNSTIWSWQANQSWFKKEETLRHLTEAPEETEKSTAAQRADVGPGARGAHSGESCTGTDVNTGGNSLTKRLLSPGGTPQDAKSHVKRVKKPSGAQRKRLRKQKEAPYNS